MVQIIVDGKTIEAGEGRTVLEACLDNGIYIPNLCHVEGMSEPPVSCRLCFVEIDGRNKPVTACNTRVAPGLVVRTDGEAVRRLQRTALRLLLSVHKAECKSCPSNRRCPLQKMARFLGVRLRPRRLEHIERERPKLADSGVFEYVPERCVLCGKCVYVCEQRNSRPLLTFAKRGFETVVASFAQVGLFESDDCKTCRACVDICPVSALFLKDAAAEA
jgi:NADH dehydrogenase/NADH:ubiquinone oxidoreductase subunit G